MRRTGRTKWAAHRDLKRIAVKRSGLLQDKAAFNHEDSVAPRNIDKHVALLRGIR